MNREENNQNCAVRVLRQCRSVYTIICGDNWHGKNKSNLRTIDAQIVQKPKNNEPRPKFTGSYKKRKSCTCALTKMP